MRRERGDVARFVSSAAALALLVLGAPLLLASASRWRFGSANPLAGVDAPWRWFADGASATLTGPLDDGTVTDGLVRMSLCVAWAAVAVIAVTTVLEVVHLLRHRGVAMPDVRGLGWAQHVARSIAVGIVVLVPVPPSSASVASTMAELTATATVPPSAAPPPAARTESPRETRVDRQQTTHVVRPGESVYSIAERLAASSGRDVIDVADAIIDANVGRSVGPGQRFTNPAYLEVGWVLQVPTGPIGTAAAPPATAEPSDTDEHRRELVIVEPGDTLWDIAGEELGDPTEWTEIWHDNAGRDMGGGRTFDDPDLILPGWELHVENRSATGVGASVGDRPEVDPPAVRADTVAPADVTADESNVRDAPKVQGPSTSPPVTSVPDSTTPPVSAPSTAVAPIPAPAAPSSTSTTPGLGAPAGDGSESIDADVTPPGAPSPVRLEHAALLAAGVLALVAVRRRRRMRAARPRHRVPEPRSEVVDTERRLRAIDPGERTMRIDVACRAAASGLVGTGAQIGWIVASADGDITLRLTGPAELTPPWSGHGHDWMLAAEIPVELLSDDARRVGLPCIALCQLGVTPDGDEVLVDLEACGTLALEADAGTADQIVAAAAAGLASSIWAETAQLIGVSIPSDALLGHRNAHQAPSTDAALRLATELAGSTIGRDRSTFELRALRTGGEAWEPAVVLVGSAAAPETESPEPGSGIAKVAVTGSGGLPYAPVRLVAEGHRWQLHGFDAVLDLTPIGVSADDLASVTAVLDDAERPLIESLQWADDAETEPRSNPHDDVDHTVVVRLLGSVEVVDAEGTPGRFERSKTVELIAWLATHRERSTRSGARAALWELDVRDATFANVVSEARRGLARLVTPPEGAEWVERTLTDQLPLHPLVVTDADLVEARLRAARFQPPQQALTTLRPAVEMIRDMPFAGTNYLWPDAEGITSNLVLLAITAASEFAGHALSLGDTDAVFWATGRGLAVLSGHEELIGLRMRAHARTGDLAGVRQEWESYERVLVADAWSDGEPAPKLLALRRELLSP